VHVRVFTTALLVAVLGAGVSYGISHISIGQLSLTGSFPDVPLNHPNAAAIDYLAKKNIISGYPDGTFQPERTINLAEFTKIVTGSLYGSLDIENCLNTISPTQLYTPQLLFPDVAFHQWFSKYTCIAKQQGLVSGYPDGTFRPAFTINFVEAAKILTVGFGVTTPRIGIVEPWYRSYTEDLASQKAIPLSIQRFDQPLTRGEMAEMIYRLDTQTTDLPSRTYDDLDQQIPPQGPTESSSSDLPFPTSVPSTASQQSTASSTPSGPAQTFDPLSGVEYSQRLVRPSGTGSTGQQFTADVITADLDKGIRVLTDSAHTSACTTNCPAIPLQSYVTRNNGIAAMNGTAFCPPDFTHCANQINTFNYFLFNYSQKIFLNADKRDYTNAGSLFVFRPYRVEFFEDVNLFTLDTNITGAIASWPTLLVNGQIVLPIMDPTAEGAYNAPEFALKTRTAVGNRGNTLYFVLIPNSNLPDFAKVLQGMNIENAIALDEDQSAALYANGQLRGVSQNTTKPNRDLPNAIILAP